MTRRRWIVGLGAALGAISLAACGGGTTTSPGTSPTHPAGEAPVVQPTIPGMGIITGPYRGEAKNLTGAGATFPAALYSKWFSEYAGLTQVQVNYQSIGSGGGIKAISDQTVDFGATDGPMTDQQLAGAKGGEIFHIPMALGGTAVTYNLPEIPPSTKLRFTGETLAGIFLGEIKRWSDAKLKADNPGANLPDKEIVTVHRSEGSGTTFNFTDYLSSVSPAWKEKVGAATTVDWPSGLGAKGSEGVAGEVKANPYAIGYVELIYAIQNKLGVSLVKNKVDQFVEPTVESVTAAAAGAAAAAPPDLRVSIVNAEGAKAYPISTFTWILAYKSMADEAKAIALTRMLWWAMHDGQKFNADLGYAPLPLAIIAKGEEMIKAISVNGKPVFPNK